MGAVATTDQDRQVPGRLNSVRSSGSFAVFGSIALMVLVHQMWRGHLGVPFQYGGDALPHAMHVKQVLSNGWIWSDNRLGAPFGQHMQDWPVPDVLMLITAKFLGFFSDNWAAVLNVLYIGTFPLAAASAWWVLRHLGVSPWIASALGILYSLLPYHNARAEYHLFLSGYWTIPLGIWIAVMVLEGNTGELFYRNPNRSGVLALLSKTTIRTVIFIVLIATSGFYYAVFATIFIVIATIGRFIAIRRWRALGTGLLITACLFTVVVVDFAPTLLYRQEHGANFEARSRSPGDSERYGLKLTEMVLPADSHRLGPLAEMRADYREKFSSSGEGNSPALGAIGTVGLLLLIGVLLTDLRRPSVDSVISRRLSTLAVLTSAGFLVATVGGVSTLIALFVTPIIRAWNRMSICLALLAFAAVGLMLDRLVNRLGARVGSRREQLTRRAAVPLVVLLLLGVGVFDQTNRSWVLPYEASAVNFFADKEYFGKIERTLPQDADIYVMPQMAFPENGRLNGIDDYEMLRPYLVTNDLRWSYGGVRGRPESEWQDRLLDDSAPELVEGLIAVGFEGLYIDRRGLADGSSVESQIQDALGEVSPFENASGNKAFYDLRGYADRLRHRKTPDLARLKDNLLYPVFPQDTERVYSVEQDTKGAFRWARGSMAEINIYDAEKGPTRSRITFSIEPRERFPAFFAVHWPDGFRQVAWVTSASTVLSRDIDTRDGSNPLAVETDSLSTPLSTDSRDLKFKIRSLSVSPG